MIIVCGGNIDQARAHCKENDLTMGRACVLIDRNGLFGLRSRRSFTLCLVGYFHDLPDAEEIVREARTRGAAIEDLT